jgi:FAD:protein FMN transferase
MKKVLLLLGFHLAFVFSLFSQSKPLILHGFAQGTTYSITYFDVQQRDFKSSVDSILDNFNKSVSTYDTSSLISRVNRNDKNVITDKYFETCFQKSMEISKNTDGAFDITVGPLVNAWGFGPAKKQKVDSAIIDSLLKFVGYNLVELKGHNVIKKDPRVRIDFNAIAQGYSTDVISGFLESKGISKYIVEIGGEVYAKNKKNNGDPWKVGIEKPIDNPTSDNPLKAIVKLENMALSTSGNYRKFYIENGVKYSHEINPKTGFPARNTVLSASVFAGDCMTADAYATAFMVMGLERTVKFVSEHTEILVYLIYSDEKGNYKVFESDKLKKILEEAE